MQSPFLLELAVTKESAYRIVRVKVAFLRKVVRYALTQPLILYVVIAQKYIGNIIYAKTYVQFMN